MLRPVGIACALAACYHPQSELPCTVACASDADCPGAQSCGADQRCFSTTPCFMLSDAGPDIDGPPGTTCLGHWVFSPCIPSNGGTFTLDTPIDTSSDSRCNVMQQPSGPEICVIAGADITVNDIDVTGSRPLAIVALDTVDVRGVVDVASHVAGKSGPHASAVGNEAVCVGGGPGGNDISGAGGAGGSFHGLGGEGGLGGGTAIGGSPPNIVGTSQLASLRAGCSGTKGGGSRGSNGGLGGGAVYLIAGSTISVTGKINASGAGAPAPQSSGGGGGGGAGGMIVLDANTVSVQGTLLAYGGSGATGGGSAVPGDPGNDPDLAIAGTPAVGPTNNNGGGAGGAGCGPGLNGVAGGTFGAQTAGGGGGGAAAGFIVFSPTSFSVGGQASPAPVVKP